MKYFILLLFFVTSIFAQSINESLLKVHAVLVPKIYLMDYKFKQKLDNNAIVIALLHDKRSYRSALSLKNKIDTKYKNGIKNYSVKTKLVSYTQVSKTEANIYYLFPTKYKNIRKVIKKASSNQALTFSYLNDDLKHGIMFSLEVGSKVKPIINLSAIKSNNITFRPVLLKISKIYTNNEKNMIINNKKNKSIIEYNIYIALLDTNGYGIK